MSVTFRTRARIARELSSIVQEAVLYADTISQVAAKYAATTAEVRAEVQAIIADAGLTWPAIVQEQAQAETLAEQLGAAIEAYMGADQWPSA